MITNRLQVKLADFGLARSTVASDGREFKPEFTNNVVTIWYKCPELLLGANSYSFPVDIWSAGCNFSPYFESFSLCYLISFRFVGVIAELELCRPMFPGRSELEALDLICKVVGTPSESTWSGVKDFPEYFSRLNTLPKYTSSLSLSFAQRLSDQMIRFLERILVPDPNKRLSAKACLESSYFVSQPCPPNDPKDLPPLQLGLEMHEFQTKQFRKEFDVRNADSANISSTSCTATAGGDLPIYADRSAPPSSASSVPLWRPSSNDLNLGSLDTFANTLAPNSIKSATECLSVSGGVIVDHYHSEYKKRPPSAMDGIADASIILGAAADHGDIKKNRQSL